ncbi:multiheme c-type cytochrome [Flavitalea flava]
MPVRKIKKYQYAFLILSVLLYLGNLTCTSLNDPGKKAAITDTNGKEFSGSAACKSCHEEIYKTHIGTAHYRDSRVASREYIRGSMDSGRNRVVYTDGTEVLMEKENERFFQTSFKSGKKSQREPFDMVIGSGRKGQTYLYWNGRELFQLPVSYFTPEDSWCNSPGYPINKPFFDRRVPSYCMECHSTYVRIAQSSMSDYENSFDKNKILYGIDCEKCHGPGAEHVAFHKANPGEKTGRYIINTHLLTRQQRLDACGLCHSGSRYRLRPAFSFRAGDTLDKFSSAKYSPDSVSTLDVHGNQYGLLTSSRCFLQSKMDCSTCHNPHANEAGNPQLFSQRCMNCHTEAAHNTCTLKDVPGPVLANNCIDCHMPSLSSQKIVLTLANRSNPSQSISNLVRTHHIAIYPQQTKAFLEKLKNGMHKTAF